MNGQLHTSAVLPPVHIEEVIASAPEPVWMRWRREKIPFLPLSKMNPGHPARSLVTMLTEIVPAHGGQNGWNGAQD